MVERFLRFPDTYSLGGIYRAPREQPETWELLEKPQGLIVNPDNQPINWEWLDDARKNVVLEAVESYKYRLKISTQAAGSLAALENIPQDTFRVIDASRTQVVDLGLTHIALLQGVRILELAYTPITDAGLGFISRLEQLESLGLTATGVTADGLIHISSLRNLKELWLNGTLVDDESLENLNQLQELRILGLSGTKLTAAGLNHLKSLKNLRRLYAFNTTINQECVEELRRAIPGLRVKWKRQTPSRPEFTLANLVELSLTTTTGNNRLSEEKFWSIIDQLDWQAQGDDENVLKPAVEALLNEEEEVIFAFQDMLAQKLYDLDGEKYAREIGNDSFSANNLFSSNWFLAVRACAVANGKALYDSALSTPANMPKDLEFAALLNLAPKAYRAKTGQAFNYLTQLSYETFANRQAWPNMRN